MREYHVRFCEGLGVKFPGPTRHKPKFAAPRQFVRSTPDSRGWRREAAAPGCEARRRGSARGRHGGRAHGPGHAEPGGPHDGERGGGHQQARQTGPRRDDAGPRAAFPPRLVSCEHRRIKAVVWRQKPYGCRMGQVGNSTSTRNALGGRPAAAVAAAAEASEWRPNPPFCCQSCCLEGYSGGGDLS